jgi:hypothetical protein
MQHSRSAAIQRRWSIFRHASPSDCHRENRSFVSSRLLLSLTGSHWPRCRRAQNCRPAERSASLCPQTNNRHRSRSARSQRGAARKNPRTHSGRASGNLRNSPWPRIRRCSQSTSRKTWSCTHNPGTTNWRGSRQCLMNALFVFNSPG